MSVALFIQHAKPMLRVILSMARFSEKKKVTDHSMRFDFLYIFSETFLILRRIQWQKCA